MWTPERMRRRLNLAEGVRGAVLPVWAGVAGVVAIRLVVPAVSVAGVAVAAVGVALGIGASLRRRAWTDVQASIVLDTRAGAGGLTLALREARGGAWQIRADDLVGVMQPAPLGLGRPIGMILTAVAFAVVVWTIPVKPPPARPPDVAAQTKIDRIAEKQADLAEELAADPVLAQELQKLKEEVEKRSFDAADWSAADAADAKLDEAAADRAQKLAAAAEAADRLSKALEKGADAETVARERDALSSALSKIGGQEAGAPDEKTPGKPGTSGRQPGAEGDAKETAALREALQRREQALEKKLEKQGKGSGSASKQGGPARPCLPGEKCVPGASHGPAPDVPLSFGDETTFADRLAFEPLKKGQAGDDPDALYGLQPRTPKAGDAVPAAPLGAAAGPDDAVRATQQVPPRHRALVRRYFETPTP